MPSAGCCGLWPRRGQSRTPGPKRESYVYEEPEEDERDYGGLAREDTTTSRRSTFSLEDEEDEHVHMPRENTTMSAISVQSTFSLEDEVIGNGYANTIDGRPFDPDVAAGSRVVNLDNPTTGSMVLLNLYDFGGMGSFLNRTVLDSMGMGVFHCAIEVYGNEWSFVFHKERSRAANSTGVVQNKPQRLRNHLFNQSVEVGWTTWTEEEVKKEVRRLAHQWRAKSYHVTRRNCITFAEEFVKRLGLSANFPAWVKAAPELGKSNATLSVVIDNTWDMLAGVEPTTEPVCRADDDEMVQL